MIKARELMPDVRFAVPEMDGETVTAAGPAAEGAVTSLSWFSTVDTEASRAFVQSYTERYGEAPLAWAAQSYATLHIPRHGNRRGGLDGCSSGSGCFGKHRVKRHRFGHVLF